MQLISPIIVGRDDELRQIDEALRSVRNQDGRTIFLLGEGGIGKSRLAAEAVDRARTAGMAILCGRASAVGPAVPFRPIAEAVLSYGPFSDAQDGAPGDPELDPYRPALGQLARQWDDEPGSPSQRSLLVVAESVLRLVIAAGRRSGCLVLLEDLHDADAETLAVVEYLIDHVARHQVLLLLTARPEMGAALNLARSAQRRRACGIVELSGLDGRQVRQLLGHCLQLPPGAVPAEVTERLCHDGDGNPFVIEELLAGLVETGVLVRTDRRWSVVGRVPTELPHTVVASITHRAERMGRDGLRLLQVAALFGRRFPLSLVQAVAGDTDVVGHVRAAIAAQLVVADEPAPDWYAFRHALTADALLASMVPVERAELAVLVADEVQACHPGLPGHWCQLVAGLRRTTGQRSAAAHLYAEAGRRALDNGAPASAVALLDEAASLAGEAEEPALRVEVLTQHIRALTAAGHLSRAAAHMSALDTVVAVVPTARRVELLTGLAWAAAMSGRWAEGRAWVDAARAVLPHDAGPEQTAPIDAVGGCLTMSAQTEGWREQAALLAGRAVETALTVPLPVTACQALEVLAVIARNDDIKESDTHFEHILALAERHNLPSWRIRAFGKLGGNDFMRDGATARLESAQREALRCGALRDAYSADATLALAEVLRGRYQACIAIIDRCAPAIARLQLDDLSQYLTMARAVAAAHQGRRDELRAQLTELGRWGIEAAPLTVLAGGLATAFCALVEEDRAAARAELDRTLDLEGRSPTIYGLSGTGGLRVLLDVLDHPDRRTVVSDGRAKLRWNRQFTAAALAVSLGRAGRGEDAAAAMAEALRAAEPFGLARHLVLRMAAEAAVADGWGDPAGWARTAESYFHGADLPAPASACRSVLRSAGVSVSQHRDGWERVPPALRQRGITVREYEVFVLLADWLTNSEIGGRLYISPRTVEKHVAGLLAKTGSHNRTALCRLAATSTATHAAS